MDERKMWAHRAKRLREYLETYLADGPLADRRANLMRKGKLSKGRLSQMETSGFGERAGERLSKSLGIKDPRWFERPLGTPPNEPPQSLTVRDVGTPMAVQKPENALPIFRIAKAVQVVGSIASGFPEKVWEDGESHPPSTREYAFVATSDPDAFLIEIDDDVMAPKYEPGQFALVEPNADIDIEDDVLVRLLTGRTVLRRLASRRDWIVLTCLKYQGSSLTVRPAEVAWMYYVAHPVPAKKVIRATLP